MPVYYDGEQIAWHRLDMVVDDRLVVECKSAEPLPPIAKRQLLAYLRSTRFEVGLLLHFGHRAKFHCQVYSNDMHRPSRSARQGDAGRDR